MKKIISVITIAAMGASLAAVTAYADGDEQMKVLEPKYYQILDENTENEVEAPVDGAFAEEGTFKSEVEITDGSGEDAVFIGAVYDADGKIASVALDKKETALSDDTLSVTVEYLEGQTFKTFIWDSLSDMNPLEFYVAPPEIVTLRAAKTYTDGIELRWTTANAEPVTGYTVLRNDEVIAESYQMRTYYDKGLEEDTEYSYIVIPEYGNGDSGIPGELTASTDVFAPPVVTEVSAQVNADGTALEGDIELRSALIYDTTASGYDYNALFSGTAGRDPVGGKHYLFNAEYTGYPSNKAWQRWKNGFYFKVPDDFLSGSDYEAVEIEFDYYAPTSGTIELMGRNDSKADTKIGSVSAVTNAWTTKVFTVEPSSGVVFSNKFDGSADLRINFGNQLYINKIIVRKLENAVQSVMPEHEIEAEVNVLGIGTSGDLIPSIWSGSYDRDIGYSGTDNMEPVEGKHYLYNREFAGYTQAGQGWKRWKNGFYFKIPDEFLSGRSYEKVEIEVEYYVAESTQIELVCKNASGNDQSVYGKIMAVPNKWVTQTFTITADDGKNIAFSNGFDSAADFRFNSDCQCYIHKVTVKKDMFED